MKLHRQNCHPSGESDRVAQTVIQYCCMTDSDLPKVQACKNMRRDKPTSRKIIRHELRKSWKEVQNAMNCRSTESECELEYRNHGQMMPIGDDWEEDLYTYSQTLGLYYHITSQMSVSPCLNSVNE